MYTLTPEQVFVSNSGKVAHSNNAENGSTCIAWIQNILLSMREKNGPLNDPFVVHKIDSSLYFSEPMGLMFYI